MRLFSKTYYHGTPYKFDKFNFDFIGTGEGAQVHGWGIYLAEDKKVSEDYRDKLTTNKSEKTIIFFPNTSNEIKFVNKDSDKLLDYLENNFGGHCPSYLFFDSSSKEEVINKIQKQINSFREIKEESDNNAQILRIDENLIAFEKIIEFLKANEVEFSLGIEGALLEVSVDDDCNFVDEAETIGEESPNYEAFVSVWNELKHEVSKYRFENRIDDIFDETIGYYPGSSEYVYKLWPLIQSENEIGIKEWMLQWGKTKQVTEDLAERITKVIMGNYKRMKEAPLSKRFTFYWFRNRLIEMQNEPKDISLSLLHHGIDGITYDGKQDGRCLVLFNLNKCNIKQEKQK